MDGMFEVLQWVVPSGAAGSVLTWLFGRTLRRTREAKEVHDTYKQMYEDVSSSLITLQKKNEENNEKLEELTAEYQRTRRAFNRLSRAIEAIQQCDYRGQCPVRGELQIGEDIDAGSPVDSGRQRDGKRGTRREHKERRRDSGDGDGSDTDQAGARRDGERAVRQPGSGRPPGEGRSAKAPSQEPDGAGD